MKDQTDVEQPEMLGKRAISDSTSTPTKIRTAVKTRTPVMQPIKSLIPEYSGQSILKEVLSPAREVENLKRAEEQTESLQTRATGATGDSSSLETAENSKRSTPLGYFQKSELLSRTSKEQEESSRFEPSEIQQRTIPPDSAGLSKAKELPLSSAPSIPPPPTVILPPGPPRAILPAPPTTDPAAVSPLTKSPLDPRTLKLTPLAGPSSSFFSSFQKLTGKVNPGLKITKKESIATTVQGVPLPPPITDFTQLSPIEIDSSSEEIEDDEAAAKKLSSPKPLHGLSFLQASSLGLLDDSCSPEMVRPRRQIENTTVFDLGGQSKATRKRLPVRWTAQEELEIIERILARKYGANFKETFLKGQPPLMICTQPAKRAAVEEDEDVEVLTEWIKHESVPWYFDCNMKFDFNTGTVLLMARRGNQMLSQVLPDPFQVEYYPGCGSYHRQYVLTQSSMFYISDLGAVIACRLNKLSSVKLGKIEDAVSLCRVQSKLNSVFVLTRQGLIYVVQERKTKVESYEIKEYLQAKPSMPFSGVFYFTTLAEIHKYLFVCAYSPERKTNWLGIYNTNLNLSSWRFLENQGSPLHQIQFASLFRECFRVFLLNAYDTLSYMDVEKGKIVNQGGQSNINLLQLKNSHLVKHKLRTEAEVEQDIKRSVHMYCIRLKEPINVAKAVGSLAETTGPAACQVVKASFEVVGVAFKTVITATLDEGTIKKVVLEAKASKEETCVPSQPEQRPDRVRPGTLAPMRPAMMKMTKQGPPRSSASHPVSC